MTTGMRIRTHRLVLFNFSRIRGNSLDFPARARADTAGGDEHG